VSAVVIVAVGSHGDVAPLTGVGVRLQQAGHHVVITAFSPFADLITGCGLGFRELPAALKSGEEVSPAKSLAAFVSPAGMRQLGQSILAAVADEDADILLLSPFAEMAGHAVAEANGVPSMGVRLQPLSATALYPPAVLGGWSAGAIGNRVTARAGAWLVDRAYGGVVAGLRRDLGLPKASARRLRALRTEANWPILHGYSPIVAPRPADWRTGLEVTGYWWPAAQAGFHPPGEVADFLAAGPPPVFVGFGSVITTRRGAQQISGVIRSAARRAGVRVIVQTGWANLEVIDDDMLTVGEIPHDWLFPQVAAVAHHCGAGTTAAGLRAGVPMIGLPGLGDGPFWAKRCERLGVSAATILQRRLTSEPFAAAMHTALTNQRLRDTSREIAGRIAAEDGAAQAVRAVENLVGQSLGDPRGC
jgi:sterol 3beta-glucosyltransferase